MSSSPRTVPFAIVDVFSSTPFRGNPLSVVENTEGALATTQMQLIARQFNLSETTFFTAPDRETSSTSSSKQRAYRLRSFLPDGREVFGAGHNILGVWWSLAAGDRLDLSKANSIDGRGTRFKFSHQLGDQESPIEVLRETPGADLNTVKISMRQVDPQAHAVHPKPDALAAAIGLSTAEIGLVDACTLKPQVMSTSTTRHLHVPLANVDALNRVAVSRDKLLEVLQMVDEKSYGLFLFTKTPDQPDTYQARFFSPGMSGEDPATGSAAGPLSALLYQHDLLTVDDSSGVGRITVVQGLRVGRECRIQVQLTVSGSQSAPQMSVDLIGGGAQIAQGSIRVPDAALSF